MGPVKKDKKNQMTIPKIFFTNTIISLLFCFFLLFSSASLATETSDASTTDKNEESGINLAKIDEDTLSRMSEEERKWYIKFQEGLMFFDGWQQISEEILLSISPDIMVETRFLLKTVGVKIGAEWCKDNDVRRIDTDQLRSWGKRLKKVRKENPSDIPETLKTISNEVDVILKEG